LDDEFAKDKNPFSLQLLFLFLVVIWVSQQGFYGIMFTYYISVLMQQFEKHYAMMPTYFYRTKAAFNEETYPILDLFNF